MRPFSFSLLRIAQWCAVILPLTLTHLRGLAEADLDILAILFLIHSWRQGVQAGGWDWARAPWMIATFAWWAWQVMCTALISPGHGALGQALAAIRFPMAAASLGFWVLQDRLWRMRVLWVTCACGAYIALQMLIQAIFGRNLFGVPRFPDGTLTGPYPHPRAAAPLSRLILPMLMVACMFVEKAKNVSARIIGLSGATLLAVSIMVLAGQRMPFALSLLGMMVCAMLYRPLRPAAFIALASAPALVILTSIISPKSFSHLFILAKNQLSHFGSSPYGEIFTHALVMAQQHPIFGQGYDAYRHHCADPSTFHGITGLSTQIPLQGWSSLCVQHPHNHYLQALVNGGVIGLFLFVVMIIYWLKALWPGKNGSAISIGLFAAVFIQEWPFASSSDFLNLPLSGWGFLLLGLGLSFHFGVHRGGQLKE
ncbi:O-antigen ligase family protein [Swingsia samuiensis]|uniref:O-antigen ligase domain-containing protein n=1 Tax=Swingsia samuiensis TaxID=1293412 RepID=A0A4Y6UIE6_9PROT|nr:O-antigen ligase family protein [Swingsia samuiensis]QDH16590.1 O-antigen ligase domain-containing protein [Swingsia samuiensis]